MANTKKIRDQFNLTQKDLSVYTTIPLRTIENWDYRDCMPDYMDMVLYLAIQSLSHIASQRLFKDFPLLDPYSSEARLLLDKYLGEEVKWQVETTLSFSKQAGV